MLSAAQDIQNQIAPYQNALNTALDVATSLPLVGQQFKDLQELDTALTNALASIEAQTQNLTSGHFQLAIPLPSISHTFTFDLGLDNFLQFSTSGGVAASLNPVLNVGFDYQNGTATINTAETNLDLGFGLALPSFQASLSFNHILYAHAVDQGTNFNGHLKFIFGAGNSLSPQFSGDAHIRLGLSLNFVDPALNASFNPSFSTNLELDWALDPQSNQLMTPHIVLRNFGMDASSFLHGFMGDIVKTVQKFTKPLQPFIDVFDTPVPILSAFDSSQTIGDLLLQGAGFSADQQDRFELMIKVIKAVNVLDLSGTTGGGTITFGDINLTGDARQLGGFNFDTSQIQGVVDDIFNSPLFEDVQDTLETVANYAGFTSTAGFQFPLLEDPGPVLGGILTGQARTMFSFSTGREHFELAPSVGVGIKDLLGIFLTAGITFDANLSMGYDTAGLIKFVQDPLKRPEDLLHGFYFDNSIDTSGPPVPNVSNPKKTALYLQGFAELSASAVVTISGGLYANLNVELASPDNSSHVYLDTIIQNIGNNAKAFNFAGQLYAAAQIELTFPTVVGPDITLFSYELAKETLINFDPPPPPTFSKPLVVVDVTNDHTLELDVSKMTPGSVVTVQPVHDLPVSGGFVADGIRVDYANEIDIYVERKNDVTTNYYNLIGLSGAIPDGVSVNVIDPFRMFKDEGVPEPEPLQTTPGVLLVGGKNVNYKYSEASDGTHAKVLLVGGYGSSTLTGGTMEFGNFIPAARIDQAKQHFGNVSGFDAAGQALINAQIDAVVAPASPAGIIGSTMTASHGGLMFGGPGNNSFIATGPGNYEMIGGTWLNTFNISPSFSGVPATYQIDGGPFGQSQLIVRVPAGENVVFENSAVVDKYNSTYKALAVQANAGLAATAHGIQKVRIVASTGAGVTIGDTSELNIDFSITGGAHLIFGGTSAHDEFNVYTVGSYYDQKDHFTVPKFGTDEYGIFHPFANYGIALPSRMPNPVYYIARYFGTNGRSQTIPFEIADNFGSAIELNAAGASDTYYVTLGVGSFVNVTVNDSDTAHQNELTVQVRDSNLVYNTATITDNEVQLDYYTDVVFHDLIPVGVTGFRSSSASSAHYNTSVFFGANDNLIFEAPVQFIQTIINRPIASQPVQVHIGGFSFASYVPYASFGPVSRAFDLSTNPFTDIIFTGATPRSFVVEANGGNLAIDLVPIALPMSVSVNANAGTLSLARSAGWTGNVDDINVLGNSGTLNISYDTNFPTNQLISITHRINVLANTGTINSTDSVTNAYTGLNTSTFSAQINVGTDGLGGVQNLSNVHGTINLLGPSGYQSLNIDDRNRVGTSPAWLIEKTQTQIADLTINYDVYGVGFQAFWKSGTAVTYRDNVQFSFRNLNGLSTYPNFPLDWNTPSLIQNSDGESVALDLSAYFGGQPPAGTTTYSVVNLPPGLSLNSATGLISGTIPFGGYVNSPDSTLLSATNGLYTRQWTIEWNIFSAITIYIPYFEPLFPHPVNVDETVPVSFDPISVSDNLNRTAVVTVTGLPVGLSFNPNTGVISGTVPAGASTHGPYEVHVHADDGLETNDIAFPMIVSGIQLTATPIVRLNHNGDAVNFNLGATTTSGGTLAYSATGLPAGITLSTATGQITGTLAANAHTQSPYFVQVSYDDGYSTKSSYITWTVLQAGVTDQISFPTPSSQSNIVGDNVAFSAHASTSLSLPLQFSVQGMPPGLTFVYDPNYLNGVGAAYISGTVPAAAVLSSPYQVTIIATDGLNSVSVTFQWQIAPAPPPALPGDFDGDHIVDQADYSVWRGNYGQSVAPYTFGDGNGDGYVDTADWVVWRDHLGQSLGGGAAIAIVTVEPITTAGSLALASTVISSDFAPLILPIVSKETIESHAAIFGDLGTTLPQRVANKTPIHSPRSLFTEPSRLFWSDNLLLMSDGQARFGPHFRHSATEAARFSDESSGDAGVVDQALEELDVAVDSQRWIL